MYGFGSGDAREGVRGLQLRGEAAGRRDTQMVQCMSTGYPCVCPCCIDARNTPLSLALSAFRFRLGAQLL